MRTSRHSRGHARTVENVLRGVRPTEKHSQRYRGRWRPGTFQIEASRRRGLTLLEVMLALAILGGSLATIGELMRIGSRNAEIARDKTTAQLLAETTMNELEVGFLPLQTSGQAAVADVEYQEDWFYSVEIQPIDQGALVSVSVTVEQNSAVYTRPVSLTLTRWMIDETLLTTTSSATGG